MIRLERVSKCVVSGSEQLTILRGIDLHIVDDLENARARVRDASFAIWILGAFVLGCGILTLIGSVMRRPLLIMREE